MVIAWLGPSTDEPPLEEQWRTYWPRSLDLIIGTIQLIFKPEQYFSLTTFQPEQCFGLFFQPSERGLIYIMSSGGQDHRRSNYI